MTTTLSESFDGFYAVVLDHPGGGPLRWSAEVVDWVRADVDGEAGDWLDHMVVGDTVDDGQLQDAVTLAQEFRRATSCERCGAAARQSTHFIAPDLLGKPMVYCVLAPNYEVVGSRGGGGSKKHWGSPDGCMAVRDEIVSSDAASPGRHAVVAAYVYGEPLSADEIMARSWCYRCSGTASNASQSTANSEAYDRKTQNANARLLARRLLDEY